MDMNDPLARMIRQYVDGRDPEVYTPRQSDMIEDRRNDARGTTRLREAYQFGDATFVPPVGEKQMRYVGEDYYLDNAPRSIEDIINQLASSLTSKIRR